MEVKGFLPAKHADPEEVFRLSVACRAGPEQELYRALPWTSEELEKGSVWRSVWTGQKFVLTEGSLQRYTPIGRLEKGIFFVGFWVRVDHLDLRVQLGWYGAELANNHLHEGRARKYADRAKSVRTKKKWLDDARRAKVDAENTLQEAEAFAKTNGLLFNAERLINAGRMGQLMMF